MKRLAVDAMSGDRGHQVVVGAVQAALTRHPKLGIYLVGEEQPLSDGLSAFSASIRSRVEVVPAVGAVAMDTRPAQALRNDRDSSMGVALKLVASGKAGACVSAGNTGALMAMARYLLKMLPGVDRPAIIGKLPSSNGHTYMLDLGANVDCSADHLYQFAVMGSALVTELDSVVRPRVGLLNIGSEEIKGNDAVKRAAAMLEASSLNFVGFIEGGDIYLGAVDVVVCDGFAGNVAIKASEGTARLMSQFTREQLRRTLFNRMVAVVGFKLLNDLHSRFDPRQYDGASLLGLNGIVVKSHGSTDAVGFGNALSTAVAEMERNLPEKLHALLDRVLGGG